MDSSETPFFDEEIFRRLFRSSSDKSIGNKRSGSFQNLPPACNLSEICTLFKNMFYLPKLV